MAGQKITGEVLVALFPVFSTGVRQKHLLAVSRNIQNDALAAKEFQGRQVDVCLTVALVEQGYFMPAAPGSAPAQHGQVELFGGKDGRVPIHDIQATVCAQVQVAGVDIGVAEHQFGRPLAQRLGELLGPGNQPVDLAAPGSHMRSQLTATVSVKAFSSAWAWKAFTHPATVGNRPRVGFGLK